MNDALNLAMCHEKVPTPQCQCHLSYLSFVGSNGVKVVSIKSKCEHEPQGTGHEGGDPYAVQSRRSSPYVNEHYNIFHLVVALRWRSEVFCVYP